MTREATFEQQLSALVSKEMRDAHGDFERMATVVERLINAAGLACAMGSGGDPKGMATMLEGMEGYLYEAASSHAKLGAFMAAARSPR